MSSGRVESQDEQQLAGYDSETLGSTQEGVPFSYFAGRRKLAGKPLTPTYNLDWEYAEEERPGKK